MTLNDSATLIGLALAVAGFVIAILVYNRDTAKITVELFYDYMLVPEDPLDGGGSFGLINVANVGRRPIFISHAALELPKKAHGEANYLVLAEGLPGDKLAEGDPPKSYKFKQDQLTKYTEHWREIRAQVTDSTGTIWRSKTSHFFPN